MVIFNRYVKLLEGTSGPVVHNHVFVLNADVGTPDKKHLSVFGPEKMVPGFSLLWGTGLYTYFCLYMYICVQNRSIFLSYLYIYIYTFKFGVSTSSMFILFVTIGYKYIKQPF